MSNDELAAAIAWTSHRIRECAHAEPQYKQLNDHLAELLLVQRQRAAIWHDPAALRERIEQLEREKGNG